MKSRYKFSFITFIAYCSFLLPGAGFNGFAAVPFQEEAAEEEEMTAEEVDAYNEQLDAYMAAVNEEDLLKRGDMLLQFMVKYPDSKLTEPYIKPAYAALLNQCYQDKKYQELEPLAEKWLKLYPENLQTISYAATAAKELKHDKKFLDYLLKLYDMNPTVGGAYEIAKLYDEQGNFDKYIEWCEKTFTYPEFSVDYTLRFQILTKYADKTDFVKASEYAEKILQVLDVAPKPDAAGMVIMRTIRRECNRVIAFNYFDKKEYMEAIKFYKKALKVEKYQGGFYYIGQCYWRLQNPEEAHDYFAAAELMGGDLTEKAKEHKEELYRTLHNNTLIGIDKVHKRAQAIIDSYSEADAAQKKTELATGMNS